MRIRWLIVIVAGFVLLFNGEKLLKWAGLTEYAFPLAAACFIAIAIALLVESCRLTRKREQARSKGVRSCG